MSHDEERGNGAGFRTEPVRAPRHWLNALVGLPFTGLMHWSIH